MAATCHYRASDPFCPGFVAVRTYARLAGWQWCGVPCRWEPAAAPLPAVFLPGREPLTPAEALAELATLDKKVGYHEPLATLCWHSLAADASTAAVTDAIAELASAQGRADLPGFDLPGEFSTLDAVVYAHLNAAARAHALPDALVAFLRKVEDPAQWPLPWCVAKARALHQAVNEPEHLRPVPPPEVPAPGAPGAATPAKEASAPQAAFPLVATLVGSLLLWRLHLALRSRVK